MSPRRIPVVQLDIPLQNLLPAKRLGGDALEVSSLHTDSPEKTNEGGILEHLPKIFRLWSAIHVVYFMPFFKMDVRDNFACTPSLRLDIPFAQLKAIADFDIKFLSNPCV